MWAVAQAGWKTTQDGSYAGVGDGITSPALVLWGLFPTKAEAEGAVGRWEEAVYQKDKTRRPELHIRRYIPEEYASRMEAENFHGYHRESFYSWLREDAAKRREYWGVK